MGPESVEESLAGGPPQGVDLVDPKQCQAKTEGGPNPHVLLIHKLDSKTEIDVVSLGPAYRGTCAGQKISSCHDSFGVFVEYR